MRRTARVMLLTAVLAGYSAPGDGVATPSTPTNTSRPPALPTAANGSDRSRRLRQRSLRDRHFGPCDNPTQRPRRARRGEHRGDRT